MQSGSVLHTRVYKEVYTGKNLWEVKLGLLEVLLLTQEGLCRGEHSRASHHVVGCADSPQPWYLGQPHGVAPIPGLE